LIVLVVVACVAALASPLVAARWPAGLLLFRWRHPYLVWAALGVQLLAIAVTMPHGFAPSLHVLTYVVALVFLGVNWRAPGVPIVALGAALNGVVIALNGGVLPATAAAVASAGFESDSAFANSAVLDHPVLPWLGDVFAWPAPLPLANTFSVGDVIIVVGAAVAAWTGTRRLRAARSPTS